MTLINKPSISTLSLVLLITGAIDSIRNLPATAWFGSQLIFFFIFSAVIFLIPVALVSAELASIWSDEDQGIYGWVKEAFGKPLAFVTIWFQWINTLVWYPTILLFISSTLAYLIDPSLANQKTFSILTCMSLFWMLTLLSLKGLHTSARVAGICAILGMIIPMVVIIILGFLWLALGHPSAINLDLNSLIPNLKAPQAWISLTAIMTSFLGMELAAVHVQQIKEPQKTYPKAMFYSVILILFTMIFGSLAIAVVLPQSDINLVLGVLQTGSLFLNKYHLDGLVTVFGIMVFIGSAGNMINWILGPANGMSFAARDGFIPKWLAHRSINGQPKNLLITQALMVSLFCLAFLLLPNINAIYWFFTALSTEIYMCMYVLMFLAAIHIKRKFKHLPRKFQIPGNAPGYYFTCVLGLMGCGLTLFIGFFPPQEALALPHPDWYKYYFGGGLGFICLPALIGIGYQKLKKKIS